MSKLRESEQAFTDTSHIHALIKLFLSANVSRCAKGSVKCFFMFAEKEEAERIVSDGEMPVLRKKRVVIICGNDTDRTLSSHKETIKLH